MSYSAWTTERVEVDIANLQLSAAKARLIRLTYPLLFLSFFLWLLLSPITCGPVPYLCTIIDALSGPECVRIQQSSKGYTIVMAMHLVAYPICLVYIAIPRLDSMF